MNYLAVFFSILSMVLWLFSFLYFRSWLKRRTARAQLVSEIQEDVATIVTELNRITERDISLLEERENSVKALLEEAEKRFKVYARELDRSKSAEKTYQELGKNRLLRTLEVLPDREPTGDAQAALASPPPPEKPAEPAAVQGEAIPLRDQVRELAKTGLSSRIIASRLGVSITEVELIMDLLGRRA
jgi:hypothetical protein